MAVNSCVWTLALFLIYMFMVDAKLKQVSIVLEQWFTMNQT